MKQPNTLPEPFASLRLARYRLVLQAGAQGLELPPYKGSTLRGGFGVAFKRIACARMHEECVGCLLKGSCPYALIFESSPAGPESHLGKLSDVPRPFVLDPPLEQKTLYSPGEKLTFGLLLVGKACSYLPYFLVAFRELGSIGLGKGRKTFTLDRVEAVDFQTGAGQVVYQQDENQVVNQDLETKTGELALPKLRNQGRVAISYRTMTRLKHEDRFVKPIEFHVLIRGLLRRLSSLVYFYEDLEPDADYKGLIERASGVNIDVDSTAWVDWERYSNRQKARMNLGGVVGSTTYQGDIEPWLPWLAVGQQVHVGKNATFGMGWFEVEGLTEVK